LVSPSDKLELLPSKLPGSDPGGSDILTYFEVFGVDGGGAAFGGGGGGCSSCWNSGTHAMFGGEGGLSVGLDSSQ